MMLSENLLLAALVFGSFLFLMMDQIQFSFSLLLFCSYVATVQPLALLYFALGISILFTFSSSPEQDENPQSLYQRRVDASSNLTGPTLRNIMLRSTTFTERKLR